MVDDDGGGGLLGDQLAGGGQAHTQLRFGRQEIATIQATGLDKVPDMSWMNQVEIWFGNITRQSIRRGTFSSVKVLIGQIRDYINHWNANPKPFVWTATLDKLLEKIDRCRRRLEEIEPGCTRPVGKK